MKAMLDANMVTIKTQGPLQNFCAPGAASAAASSHGDLIGNVIR